MNEALWSEFGIDWEKLSDKLNSKRNKPMTLTRSISDQLFTYLKQKFNLPEQYKTDALRNLWEIHQEDFENLYVLCKSYDNFNEDVIKKYYRKKYGNIENSLLFMLARSLFEDLNLLRQIHYGTMLAVKKLVSAVPDSSVENLNLNNLTEEEAENFAKQIHQHEANQNTINVWYILKDDDASTVFIFKNCKARAKIPSIEKRKHQFIQHSRPVILKFTNGGNLLEVHSSSNEQAFRMGSKIISNYASTPTNEVDISFSHQEVLSPSENVSILVSECLNETEGCPLELLKLSCKPKEEFNDCDLIFLKNRDSLKSMKEEIEKALSTNITPEKIHEIKVKFKEKLFSVYFESRENNQFLVAFSSITSDTALNREFREVFLNKYGTTLVRRA